MSTTVTPSMPVSVYFTVTSATDDRRLVWSSAGRWFDIPSPVPHTKYVTYAVGHCPRLFAARWTDSRSGTAGCCIPSYWFGVFTHTGGSSNVSLRIEPSAPRKRPLDGCLVLL